MVVDAQAASEVPPQDSADPSSPFQEQDDAAMGARSLPWLTMRHAIIMQQHAKHSTSVSGEICLNSGLHLWNPFSSEEAGRLLSPAPVESLSQADEVEVWFPRS